MRHADGGPDASDRCRVLILGAGKSGTTGLYASVLAGAELAYGKGLRTIFEPKASEDISCRLSDRMVVKMLLERFIRTDGKLLDWFDKVVFIHRDPRDNVVSRLLWQVASLAGVDSAEKVDQILHLIREKEHDNASSSVMGLYRKIGEIANVPKWFEGAIRYAFLPLGFKRNHEGRFFPLKYESYMDRDLDGLNEYLGFEVAFGAPPPARFSLTKRSGSYGAWRLWFTEEDVEYFKANHREEMVELGYPDFDRPPAEGAISADESSEYVRRIFRQKRPELFARSGR